MNRAGSHDQNHRPQVPLSLTARGLVWLNQFFVRPERPTYIDVEAYQAWLEENGDHLYKNFYSKHANFDGKTVLDLACGAGGKIVTYSQQGSSLVCGVDINISAIRKAKQYSLKLIQPPHFVGADAATLPFKDSSFDIVISDDGFDHFKQPEQVINEIVRVLKPGGIAFVSFVPYYTTECSHMGAYLRFPWHHLLFSRKVLRRALEFIVGQKTQGASCGLPAYQNSVNDMFDTFLNRLSHLSLRGFNRALVNRNNLALVRLRIQSKDWARLFTYIPALRELFAENVYCVLRKDGASRIDRFSFLHQGVLDVRQDLKALIKRSTSILGRNPRVRIDDGAR
jgi:ubiquinone/menaquinone biosynthesis C-methylase UbiE